MFCGKSTGDGGSGQGVEGDVGGAADARVCVGVGRVVTGLVGGVEGEGGAGDLLCDVVFAVSAGAGGCAFAVMAGTAGREGFCVAGGGS